MPLEYYLGGAVALIVLVLLAMALTGKKSSRRVVVTKNTDNEELTRQVARAADALEALLAHLKAHPLQATASVQETAVRPAATVRTVDVPAQAAPRVTPQKASEPQVAPATASPTSIASEPPATETAIIEPAANPEVEASAATEEQKPRRVKLSMFGR